MVYKNLAAIDLKGDSTVQYTRNLQDLVGAACVGTIVAHPVLNSYSDNFNRVSAGFGSANWLNIPAIPVPFPPLRNATIMLLDGAQAVWFGYPVANALPAPPADTKAGAYTAAAAANNWHVKATFSGCASPSATVPDVGLIASATFANPTPNENQVTCYYYSCALISGTVGVDARFRFRMIKITNGVFVFVGASFISAPNTFGPGSTWEMYLLCNNAPNPPNSNFPVTVIGIVDGVQRLSVPGSASVPAGVPGIGNIGADCAPGDFFNVTDWSADELSD